MENSDDNRRTKSRGRHQNVEEPNVYDDRAKNRQSQRNKAADQQQQSADDLEAADEVHVTTLNKRVKVFTGQSFRHLSHGNKMQECIGTKNNEDQSEKYASNDGGDFHPRHRGLIERDFQ